MIDQSEVAAFCELSQAKATYCRSLDTRDWTALATLMTDDIEFGMADDGTAPQMTRGRNETLALLQSLVANSKTVHQVHAPEIDLDGDEARVIWAVQDRAVFDNGLSVTGYGHYHERWVRPADAWKVASITLVHILTEVHQA